MDSTILNGILFGAFFLLLVILFIVPIIIGELIERKEKEDKAKFILDVLNINPNLSPSDINEIWNGFKER